MICLKPYERLRQDHAKAERFLANQKCWIAVGDRNSQYCSQSSRGVLIWLSLILRIVLSSSRLHSFPNFVNVNIRQRPFYWLAQHRRCETHETSFFVQILRLIRLVWVTAVT